MGTKTGRTIGFRRRHRGKAGSDSLGRQIPLSVEQLAFLIAFTFGLTVSRFEMCRELSLEEVNAL